MNLENLMFIGYYDYGCLNENALLGIVCRKSQKNIISKYIDYIKRHKKSCRQENDINTIITTIMGYDFERTLIDDLICELNQNRIKECDIETVKEIIGLNELLLKTKKEITITYRIIDENDKEIMKFTTQEES